MSVRRIACPGCEMTLILPAGAAGRMARCPKCKQSFRVPVQPDGVTEDLVADWLNEDESQSPAAAPTVVSQPTGASAGGTATATKPEKRAARTVAPGQIRMVKHERRGVLFEFPASRLREQAFRLAMPRRCMSCGTKAHISPHVIRFLNQALDVSAKAEHDAGALSLHEEDCRDLSGAELLERLPRVPNVPAPGDLPMPYWVCDLCSGSGLVQGQIEINTATGEGRCRLLIQPIRRAEEFFAAAGGEGSEELAELRQAIEASAEKPWDRLPSVVQERIKQWFTPADDETFVAYIPDRDHTRTEDGVAGLIVSTQRMVFHSQMRHREIPLDRPAELQLAMGRRHGHLRIAAGDWTLKHFTIDQDGVRRLRRALTTTKSKAVWR